VLLSRFINFLLHFGRLGAGDDGSGELRREVWDGRIINMDVYLNMEGSITGEVRESVVRDHVYKSRTRSPSAEGNSGDVH